MEADFLPSVNIGKCRWASEGRKAYAAGTDVEALIAAVQETPATESATPEQTKKKPVRRDEYSLNRGNFSPSYSTYYEYDVQGNMTKESYYRANGSLSWIKEYRYDAQGNLTQRNEMRYSYDGNYESTYTTRYTYDNQGKLAKEEQTVEDYNDWIMTTTYDSYDSQGNVLSKTTLDVYYDINSTGEYHETYSYDGQGNVLTKITSKIYPDGYHDEDCDTYSYDSQGNCIQMIRVHTYDDGSGFYKYSEIYSYDNQGNCIYVDVT